MYDRIDFIKKVILYIEESLDSYVATKDGAVAWLDPFNGIKFLLNKQRIY